MGRHDGQYSNIIIILYSTAPHIFILFYILNIISIVLLNIISRDVVLLPGTILYTSRVRFVAIRGAKKYVRGTNFYDGPYFNFQNSSVYN